MNTKTIAKIALAIFVIVWVLAFAPYWYWLRLIFSLAYTAVTLVLIFKTLQDY